MGVSLYGVRIGKIGLDVCVRGKGELKWVGEGLKGMNLG